MSDSAFSPVPQAAPPQAKEKTMRLALTALGIVFGDIGTSPLYALRECFAGPEGVSLTPGNILGVVSLMFWTLTLTVSVKYVLIVMRADNRGEGGILALMTLVSSLKDKVTQKYFGFIITLGILGAALLYGDGVITPAISVLSAVEGLNEVTPLFQPFVIPISIAILVVLFLFQKRGTAKVGSLFGPVIMVWFLTIALLGLVAIAKKPEILAAINPWYAADFLFHGGRYSFPVLGSVFLAVTGAEMLYADIGHFGRKPVRIAWFALVFPSLFLNYFGQGAFLLTMPVSIENLFYLLAPSWFLLPLVILATAATVIASQAVISGAFSLTHQSVQLGFWPRLRVLHTSSSIIGQVYVPFVNWCLMGGTILLILVFRQSTNLGAAYGIAVSATMLITTLLIIFIARRKWSVPLPLLVLGAAVFLFVDSAFFASNILKIESGGWIVLLIAAVIYLLMKTWREGREILRKNLLSISLDLETFAENMKNYPPVKVPGVAVFLSGNSNGVPRALLHNLKHNKVLHEHTVILSIRTEEVPYISAANRVSIRDFGGGIYRIIASFGFSETPHIPNLLATIHIPEFTFDPMQTTYFLGREVLIVIQSPLMSGWRKKLFGFMSHNALNATGFFHLPANRVVELGAQIEL